MLEALRRIVSNRGYVVDPYSMLEVATLIARYASRCDDGSLMGAEGMLSSILAKAGAVDAVGEARDIIREVVETLGGCEENHRLRSV